MTCPTGRPPRNPVFQDLPARTEEAKQLVAAFRKSHQPQIDCFDIDFEKLELLVLANMTEEEIKELEKQVYPKGKK